MNVEDSRVAVVGLGYVGLPLAVEFGKQFEVLGYDINSARVAELSDGHDHTLEVSAEQLAEAAGLRFTDQAADLDWANVYIVTTPTPIDRHRQPDLGPVLSATRAIGAHLAAGDVVIYESTVYPGATEEECVPVLEQVSGLRFNEDFFVGYSPERINPGDKQHRVHNIVKITSGSTPQTADFVDQLYRRIVTVGTHRAESIRVAEAAKVIENTQRDVNIALINELAMLFNKLGIGTEDVLRAAGSKWNFLPFRPGLVGGHCIGVDPYYLTHRAQKAGFHPEVILAGRRTNDGVGERVARECARRLIRRGRAASHVTVLGLTFKEDVPDTRNSKVVDIVRELMSYGINVQVHDPLALAEEARHEYGITLTPMEALRPADAVVLAVAHADYVAGGWPFIAQLLVGGAGVVLDVKSALDRTLTPDGIELWRL